MANGYEVENSSVSKVNFAAIALGSIIGLFIVLVFSLAGLGLSLTLFQVEEGESVSTGLLIAGGIAAIIGATVAFYVGGYTAGHFSPQKNSRDAGFHGLAAFALSALIAAFLSGSLAQAGFRLATKAATGAGAAIGANT